MKHLFTLILATLALGCNKDGKMEENCWPMDDKWLAQLKEEYASCVCLTAFYTGTYQDQPVLEVRTIDPACNSVNVVYKMDGTPWFNGNTPAYEVYTGQVQQLREVWRCSSERK